MNNKNNKIKEQRKTLAYTTRELASLANIPEKDIVDYEANKKNATMKTLEKIANATGTKVSDWVDEDYFKKSKDIENIPLENTENIALSFFLAMFRADDVMDTIYNALIDMKEIKMTKDKKVVFSEFSEKICLSIASIKLKKVMDVCEINKSKDKPTNKTVERNNNCIEKEKPSLANITFNHLLQELRVLFKNTDVIEVIMLSLINIGYIDNDGCCSEKANLLLTTIMSNKLKSLIGKK